MDNKSDNKSVIVMAELLSGNQPWLAGKSPLYMEDFNTTL
jgi:hypothetical protein